MGLQRMICGRRRGRHGPRRRKPRRQLDACQRTLAAYTAAGDEGRLQRDAVAQEAAEERRQQEAAAAACTRVADKAEATLAALRNRAHAVKPALCTDANVKNRLHKMRAEAREILALLDNLEATVVLPRGTGTSTGKIKRMLPNAARKPAPVFVKAANAVATSQKRTRLICRSRETGGFCPRKPRPSYSAAVGDQWPRFDSLLHGTRDTMLASYQRPASKVFARQTGHFLHD